MADNYSEPFLQFDPFETPNLSSALVDNDGRDRHSVEGDHQAHHGQSSSSTAASGEDRGNMSPILPIDSFANGKGKGVSRPMSIRPHDLHLDGFDMFDNNAYSYTASGSSSISSQAFYDIQPLISSNNISSHVSSSAGEGHYVAPPSDSNIYPQLDVGKGKERAPTLPPLSFMPAFGYNSLEWQPSTSSSSSPDFTSYGFACATPSLHYNEADTMHIRYPSALSEHSVSAPSSYTAQLELPSEMKRDRSSSPTIRRLSLGEHKISSPHSHPYSLPCTPAAVNETHHYDDTNFRAAQHITPALIDALVIPPFASQAVNDTIGRPVGPKLKGRSHSDPLPTASTALNDVFRAISPRYRYSFQESLPREIKIQIFASLVQLHEDDHQRLLSQGKWTARAAFAPRNRWVGRERGLRELIKFSRVSMPPR
jgi:F-box and leucine-rich repeat protein 2/20